MYDIADLDEFIQSGIHASSVRASREERNVYLPAGCTTCSTSMKGGTAAAPKPITRKKRSVSKPESELPPDKENRCGGSGRNVAWIEWPNVGRFEHFL
jgi:hypothetical protein